MKTIILIGKDGKESARIVMKKPAPWIIHNKKLFLFGVGKTNGEQYYYEV